MLKLAVTLWSGPAAYNAYTRVSRYYEAGMKRADLLSDVIGKAGGPEAVYNAALSGTKDGATRLLGVLQSLEPDQQRTVAATVLKRMRQATAGNQNAAGDTFSPQTFLTNWNRMSPEGKRALFDRFGPDLRAQVDNVAGVADNLRQGSKVFRNASGTSGAENHSHDLLKILGAVVGGNEFFGPHGAMAVAGTAAAAHGPARAATSPAVVDWAGKPAWGPSQDAALIGLPAQLSERQRLADALRAQP